MLVRLAPDPWYKKIVFTIQKLAILILLAGIFPALGASSPPDAPPATLSISQLEYRVSEIDSELEKLSRLSLRSGPGSIGWRSNAHLESAHPEWIQIELGRETPIDEIVLVPAIWRDPKIGFRADGIPLEFRIIVGTSHNTNGTVVASYGARDHLLPRIAPVVVSFLKTTASWVRVEATALSPRAWDGKFELQLAEIMVFNGQENVALHKPVHTSADNFPEGDVGARKKQYLVDGFVPYLMNAAQGSQSIAMVSAIGIGDHPWLMIDLGTIQPLNRIHLHATDVDDNVPQAVPADFGIPRRLLVEGALRPDFSDAVRLVEYHMESFYNVGPIIMLPFPETACRYVRLTAIEPFIGVMGGVRGSLIGAAEIELFAKGQNVAHGKPVTASFKLNDPDRSFSALTDGLNLYGNILPIRDWMEQLARRHNLETERPIIVGELSHHYARQTVYLKWLGWLAALFGFGICVTFLIDRIIRLRQVARIKERLAADLHDELGADLHTIGLLSDLAGETTNSSEELQSFHQRIREVTQQTGIALRHCTDMLSADGLFIGLVADLQRAAQRIMAKLEHDIEIQGEEQLNRLKPRTRVDLLLFYKECLVNISRHSNATKFVTRLTADDKVIHLTVSDNGRGLIDSEGDGIPKSLKRRARLLGAQVTAESLAAGGTRINLKLPTRRWGRRI